MRKQFIDGLAGELLCAVDLLTKGWEVFMPYSELGEVDLIARKNGRTKLIQVKSCTNKVAGRWRVDIKGLDPSKINSLMVVLPLEGRIVEIKRKNIPNTRYLMIDEL